MGALHFPLLHGSASSTSQTRPIVVDRWQPLCVAIAHHSGNTAHAAAGRLHPGSVIKSIPSGSPKVSSFTILRNNMGLQTERSSPGQQHTQRPRIWWSNGTVFVATHLAAAVGCYFYPFYAVPRSTLVLCIVLFQFAEFSSVTIRPFRAPFAHHFPG